MKIRDASLDDARLLFEWRNDPATRAASHNSDEVIFSDHVLWLEKSISNPNRIICIAEDNGVSVGTVRADYIDGFFELSWTTAPDHRGCGVAYNMTQLMRDRVENPICAEVKVGNEASVKVARKLGMQLIKKEGGVLYFESE